MKNACPLVTIIIPTYNQAELLEKALQSVIQQTYLDWEAIVVDNNSQDNSREIVEKFRDPRIKYVMYNNYGIIAASRNLGIHLSNGEYIAFLDSDDLWYPLKISKCLEQIHKGKDIVCHGLWIRKNGLLGDKIYPSFQNNTVFEMLLFYGNSGIATSAVFVTKQLIDKIGVFSEEVDAITAEDYDFWLRISKENVSWGFLPDMLGEYTIHGKNTSNSIKKQMLAEEYVVMKHYNENSSPSFKKRFLIGKRRIMIPFRAGKRAFQSGYLNEAVYYFILGLTKIWS